MKKHLHQILLFSGLTLLLSSCAKNDFLNDLGEVGDFTANIYFNPLSPLADAGQEIECEIEYWTVGDEFLEEQLLEEISTIEEVNIDFADADYSFKYEIDSVTTQKQVYESFSFDFTNWNPDRNAYLVTPEYKIDAEYAKFSVNQNSQDAEDFVNNLSEEIVAALYDVLIDVLEEDGCRSLLVEKYQLLNETEFEASVVLDNQFSEEEQSFCKQQIETLDLHLLLGSKYKYTRSTGIALSYKITNGFGAEAESYQRYFTIK